MVIPIGLALLLSRMSPASTLVVGYACFLMLVAHVFTLSRGGWISLAFSLALIVTGAGLHIWLTRHRAA